MSKEQPDHPHPFERLRAGIGTDTFNLSCDADREAPPWRNRLVRVQKNGATLVTFTFNADGKRVKSVMGSGTVLFHLIFPESQGVIWTPQLPTHKSHRSKKPWMLSKAFLILPANCRSHEQHRTFPR
jgi:hypothetical protein